MLIFCGVLVGVLISFFCSHVMSLCGFLQNMEDVQLCVNCSERQDCFALRKTGRSEFNNVSQWMLISYFAVKEKCDCIYKISVKSHVTYCVIGFFFYCVLFWSAGTNWMGILYGVVSVVLWYLSVVDWNTQYIPLECTIIIFICGLIHMFADFSNWFEYVIGLFAVSGFLLLVDKLGSFFLLKKYEGEEIASVIGDGDIKLMAATGLLLGWKLNFLALAIGCISGSVIHLIRMKIKGSSSVLALGPYLSLGVYITMICGEQLISWYLNMWGVLPY